MAVSSLVKKSCFILNGAVLQKTMRETWKGQREHQRIQRGQDRVTAKGRAKELGDSELTGWTFASGSVLLKVAFQP